MLNEALQYLKLGWSLIPTCWPEGGKCACGRGHDGNDIGKAPLVAWTPFKTRLPSGDEVTDWWTKWPLANIACIAGAISGIAVIDLEHEGLEKARELNLHSNLVSLTGKGRHLIFKHPGERVWNAVAKDFGGGKIRGFDIRGDGGYFILPPSRHASGKRYRWLTGFTPHLPPFPSALLPATGTITSFAATKPQKPANWISQALEGLDHGNRNATFASVVGRLHGNRWTPTDIRALLLPHALRVEFSETELDAVIGSITKYPITIRSGFRQDAGTAMAQIVEPLGVRRLDNDWADYQERSKRNKLLEFPTGYRRFDAITGGLRPGEILTVAARTEVGKTNWLLGAAKFLSGSNRRVLFLSTETSYDALWDRYIPLGRLGEFDSANFLVADDFAPDLPRIDAAVKEHKPNVFIFDHINYIGDEPRELAMFMRGLKSIARGNNIPGIVTAQLGRVADWIDPQTKQKTLPRMSMIKGSSVIEETSAQILLLHEQVNAPAYKQILGIVDKNRHGEKDNIAFLLHKKPYRMAEAE